MSSYRVGHHVTNRMAVSRYRPESFQLCGCLVFFFQAEDGIRDLVRSRGLGDVYKRQGGDEEGQHHCEPDGDEVLTNLLKH